MMRFERDVQPYEIPEDWLIGAQTNLMGRFTPQVERVRLPRSSLEGGKLLAEMPERRCVSLTSQRPGKRDLPAYAWDRLRGARLTLPDARHAIDSRRLAPANWSHSVNHHALQALLIRSELRKRGHTGPVTVILPRSIPGYIRRLYTLLDFETVATDKPVEGLVGQFWEEPFSCHRAAMHELCAELVHATDLARKLFEPRPELPSKVFVSRRDTRTLVNEREIEDLLATRGFIKVYPETLGIREQFCLYAQATDIVAIHGAGIGPLAYRPPNRPGRMIEILTPGHMTDFFRFFAHQVGIRWIGVRGRLWPELVADAYSFDRPFTKHSLSPFSVDPRSLEEALAATEP